MATAPKAWIVLVLAAVCALPWLRDPPTVGGDAVLEPPPLFEGGVPCSARGEKAGERARTLLASAIARWQRAPFAPADAPRAVRDLDGAVRCFRDASMREQASSAAARLARWRRALDERYRQERLALHLALQAEDPIRLSHAAGTLLGLLSEAGEAAATYRAWLLDLQRRSRAELQDARSRKEKS